MTQEIPTPDTLHRKRRRSILWRILLAVIIFIAGAASGAGLTVVVVAHRIQHTMRHPETIPPRLTAELKRRLNLTEQQAAEVESILARRQSQLQTLRQRIQPEISSQLDETHDEIAQVLTPEQNVKWNAWFDQLKTRWLPGMISTKHDENHH